MHPAWLLAGPADSTYLPEFHRYALSVSKAQRPGETSQDLLFLNSVAEHFSNSEGATCAYALLPVLQST